MSRGRIFDRDFKFAIVREIMRAELGPTQICRQHGLNERMVLRRRKEVAERGDAAFTPQIAGEADAKVVRIAELERLVGQPDLAQSAG